MMKEETAEYRAYYDSPLGRMLMFSDGTALTGLHTGEQCGTTESADRFKTADLPVFAETKQWLDTYFAGKNPETLPEIHLKGTAFQMMVWELLQEIPYGQLTTYGALARAVAKKRGVMRMSAQAVGQAVGKNPVGILVPCHRVIGKNGSLTGYAGGLPVKEALLKLEGFGVCQGVVQNLAAQAGYTE